MAPKFRGDSEDWLDDERTRKGSKGGIASKRPKAEALDPTLANATVAEVFPKQCRVRLDQDGTEFLCSYRRATVVGHGAGSVEDRERSPVAVGDRVLVERTSPDAGVVKGVCARRTALARPAPGRDRLSTMRQVIAANADLLLIVASVSEPEFSAGLVDRFLVAARISGLHPILCVSKLDLLRGEAEKSETCPWDPYRELGIEVVQVCAKSGQGIPELRRRLQDATTVFCGHSGVGKTSLLRALLESEIGKVGSVSGVTGKGRHTTTSAVLLRPEFAHGPESRPTYWIDTPGVREFGLVDVEPDQLGAYFPEFEKLGCTGRGCLHLDEEGCEARELFRYASYRRILESLLAGEH